jgi:hypothetical protein
MKNTVPWLAFRWNSALAVAARMYAKGKWIAYQTESCHTEKNVLSKPLNPLNAELNELNPICHLLALLGAQHILHVSRIRVNMVDKNCDDNYE